MSFNRDAESTVVSILDLLPLQQGAIFCRAISTRLQTAQMSFYATCLFVAPTFAALLADAVETFMSKTNMQNIVCKVVKQAAASPKPC